MKDLIPFDLEKALAGDPVVTRDGREVTELHLFEAVTDSFKVAGVISGVLENFRADGTYSHREEESRNDLFMKPEPMEVYLNVHPNEYANLPQTMEDAKYRSTVGATSIVKLSILNGEVISAETVHRY